MLLAKEKKPKYASLRCQKKPAHYQELFYDEEEKFDIIDFILYFFQIYLKKHLKLNGRSRVIQILKRV